MFRQKNQQQSVSLFYSSFSERKLLTAKKPCRKIPRLLISQHTSTKKKTAGGHQKKTDNE